MGDKEKKSTHPVLVIGVGFAGARDLFAGLGTVDERAHDGARTLLRELLAEQLRQLPADLKLGNHHVLMGISQIAIGADSLFAEACADVPWAHRVLLPQPLDGYLTAVGSSGPDFDAAQQAQAQAYVSADNVVEVRSVSQSRVRSTRFSEANFAILRACDVAVCLLPEDQPGKPGGSQEFMETARAMQRPVLELRFSYDGGIPVLRRTWHWPPLGWTVPSLPACFNDDAAHRVMPTAPPNLLETARNELETIKEFGSDVAKEVQSRVTRAAAYIVGLHVVATLLATVLALDGVSWKPLVTVFVILEVLLLCVGLSVHHGLHAREDLRRWALARVTAEVARSARAFLRVRAPMMYVDDSLFPRVLLPLVRTVRLLHLIAVRSEKRPWQERRDAYLVARIVGDPARQRPPPPTVIGSVVGWLNDRRRAWVRRTVKTRKRIARWLKHWSKDAALWLRRLERRRRGSSLDAQLPYYESKGEIARWQMRLANSAFVIFTCIAVLSGMVKLGDHHLYELMEWSVAVAKGVAVLFPVFAVATLSLAGAMDLEARAATFTEMRVRLEILAQHLCRASEEWEFDALAAESERELLSETVNWAARRSFVSAS